MTGKGQIAEYRERLDETLKSHDLTHEEALKSLVRDQVLCSSREQHTEYVDNVIHKRTAELSKFLEMLRSASTTHEESYSAWKLKQDTEECRVMYREGPLGSPFNTLLVEGYVDAPVDACLCISWEAALFPTWFPETKVPTFKVVFAECVKRISICEHISLVRVKLSWPLSDREAVMHFFEFEYFKEGLVIAMQTTLDVERIRMEVDGFSNEGIPEQGQTVRVDLIGGYALQKVTDNRSYFRTILNMDIKLDLLPPYLVNFISRQLVGGGFRLYKKTLTSATKDERFLKAMNQPIYRRIRKALYSDGGVVKEHKNWNMDSIKSSQQSSINVNSCSEYQECEVEEVDRSDRAGESSSSVYMSAEESEYSSEIEEDRKEEATRASEKVVESMKQEHSSKGRDDHLNSSKGTSAGGTHNPKKEKKGMVNPFAVLNNAICAIRKNRLEGQKGHVDSRCHEGGGGGSLLLQSSDEFKQPTMGGCRGDNRVAPPVSPEAKTSVDLTYQDLRDGSANIPNSTYELTQLAAGNQLPAGTLNSATDIAGDHDHTVKAAKIGAAGAEGESEKYNNVGQQKKTGGKKKWTLCCLHVVPERPPVSS